MIEYGKFTDNERNDVIDTACYTLFSKNGFLGREYLKSRKISSEMAKLFEIGYCPNILYPEFLSNRIIIPCHDLYGKRVAISARKTTSNESLKPFWWNEKFEKKNHLYGLSQSKKYILEKGYAIITEGQFDVISMFQEGIRNVVGLMGSGFKGRRLSLIRGYCKKIIILLDTDPNESGQKSAKKILGSLSRKNLSEVFMVELPMDYDPDKFIHEYGAKELIKYINEKQQDISEIDSLESLQKAVENF